MAGSNIRIPSLSFRLWPAQRGLRVRIGRFRSWINVENRFTLIRMSESIQIALIRLNSNSDESIANIPMGPQITNLFSSQTNLFVWFSSWYGSSLDTYYKIIKLHFPDSCPFLKIYLLSFCPTFLDKSCSWGRILKSKWNYFWYKFTLLWGNLGTIDEGWELVKAQLNSQ